MGSGDFVDAFLTLDGIKGECLDAEYKGKNVIEIDGFDLAGQTSTPGKQKKWVPRSTGGGIPPPPPMGGRGGGGGGEDDDDDSVPFTFGISKSVDTSSPALYMAYCKYAQRSDKSESIIKTGKLWMRHLGNKGGVEYLTWEFTELHVISFSWKCGNDGIPTEDVDFTFATCRFTYIPQDNTGESKSPISLGWDFKKCLPK